MAFSNAFAGSGVSHASQPDFLSRRVERFYQERVSDGWGGRDFLRGRMPGPDAVLLMSNDYLSITAHPRIVEAQREELARSGNGLLMSGAFLRHDSPQALLEAEFAAFMGVEATIVCQSGYCANTGLLQTIAGPDVPIYLDIIAHLSLWEGVRSAGAPSHAFRHNDLDHLETLIRRYGPGVIAVDSVYSTNGSLCPLPELVELTERYGCVLVVDESHSLGTHGANGEGIVASLGLQERVHFITASLAKAFAGRAGLITCPARFVDYFRVSSHPAVFSSGMLPHEIAGLRATLDVIREEGWRRERLHVNAARLREALTAQGYNLQGSASQIIGLEAGPERQTIILRDALEARSIFGSPFCPPATTANRSLIRFTVSAGLSDDDVQRVIRACEEIREEVDLANWPSTRRARRPGRKLAA